MLEPSDRRVLREALRPPQGYTVDRAIATTFSLDLVALLVAPLSFSLFDRVAKRDAPDTEEHDPLGAAALLQAVRAHAERLTVYCQAGSIASPGRYRQLLAYLEGSVVEVAAPGGGVFHPKVWVQRFISPDGPVRYRLLVNSRNLTFDRSWDTMLVLDGELADRTNAFARNHPLGEFLAKLPGLAVRPISRRSAADAAQLADEIRRVAFEVPLGFDEEMVFWPLGHDGKARWPFDTRVDRMLVISPFVGADTLARLTSSGHDHVLVSRADELAPLAAGSLDAFAEVHVLNEGAEVEPEDVEDASGGIGADEAASGLHAKLYVADAGWNAHLWTGSANATRAAFESNVEFLVQLTGKKGKIGVDAILGAEGAGALRPLLVPYVAPSAPSQPDAVAEALDQRLRALRVLVASAPWKARVEPDADATDGAERYRVHLVAEAPLDLGAGVEARCWPIAVAPEHAVPLAITPTRASATFARLSFQALTSFFAVSLVARQDQHKAEAVFVVNAPLEGAPEHRHARILQAMLDDPAKVLRFLRMLLALDPLEGIEALIEADGAPENASAGWSGSGSEAPLLEALLHALDREPARLDDFDRVVRELRATPEGAALLPPDLDTIWVPLREAWLARNPKGGRR